MRLSRTAQRRGAELAAQDQTQGIRRKTYCYAWQIVAQRCTLHGVCPNVATCPDYQDAVEHAVALGRVYSALHSDPQSTK